MCGAKRVALITYFLSRRSEQSTSILVAEIGATAVPLARRDEPDA